MKAMTLKQKEVINDLLEEVGDLLPEKEVTQIRNAVRFKTKSNYRGGAACIIIGLRELLASQNRNKENKMETITFNFNNADFYNTEEAITFELNAPINTATVSCKRCAGTGMYTKPLKDGSIGKCFSCQGAGVKQVDIYPMTKAQIAYIRTLYSEVMNFLTQKEDQVLVDKMCKHISGEQQQSCSWASAAIEKLLSMKPIKIK